MLKKTILLSIFTLILSVPNTATAQTIDRRPIVERNNPHVERIDSLSPFTVGNGRFAVTVDATGLQTYPEYYSQGVPLGTFSEWAWHSFPNSNGYKPAEVLLNHDFHRGHDEFYSSEFRQKGRQRDASNYLRANPQRMHLGCLGFDFGNVPQLADVRQNLDMWTGKVTSDFTHGGFRYHVETVCHPESDLIAVRISRQPSPTAAKRETDDQLMALNFCFPYPTGQHSDDACDWTYNSQRQSIRIISNDGHAFELEIRNDTNTYYSAIAWHPVGTAKAKNRHSAIYTLRLNDNELSVNMTDNAEVVYGFSPTKDGLRTVASTSFSDVERASAAYWKGYWTRGGIVDFSRVSDPRARELERRTVLSQYLLGVNDQQCYPPAETGLTYNSWFGKFHLEMIYWHQAWQALWGHPEALEHTLDWYFRAEPMAREIARRQGFKGVRWMKMTDPSAAEAPSNVGSYLIWQQPHVIYLAELLYRAALADKNGGQQKADEILKKYAPLVEETAEFMHDFAERDSISGRYILRGYIPAQETLKADSVRNSPFELSYWLTTMRMAQQWRTRQGLPEMKEWNELINNLSPLPSKDGVYLTSEGAPLIGHIAEQTDSTKGDDKFASDHPMPLGAFGMLPESYLFTKAGMDSTYNWIMKHWNWQKTWGWDYPMTAMCATRLGRPDDAVNALLMPVPKNTYLNNGHNWQSDRLRCYLPGNGGLLTAIALMTAGYDSSTTKNPGIPTSWDVRWEGILPLP